MLGGGGLLLLRFVYSLPDRWTPRSPIRRDSNPTLRQRPADRRANDVIWSEPLALAQLAQSEPQAGPNPDTLAGLGHRNHLYV